MIAPIQPCNGDGATFRAKLVRQTCARWVLAICVLALASFIQVASPAAALASGAHHHHAPAARLETPEIASKALRAIEPVFLSSELAFRSSDHSGCNGHGSPNTDPNSKSCCGSACCAAGLAGEPGNGMTPSLRFLSAWVYAQQFILADHPFDLNRPPNLRG